MSTLPKSISPELLAFCRGFSAEAPVFLDSQPSADAKKMACFDNVKRRVAAQGGWIEYGWAIWHVPNLYFEAEHHGVWRDKEGSLLDVSPQIYGDRRILFLPQPEAVYDPKKQRPNVIGAANSAPFAEKFAKLANERNAIVFRYRTDENIVFRPTLPDQLRISQIDLELSLIYQTYGHR